MNNAYSIDVLTEESPIRAIEQTIGDSLFAFQKYNWLASAGGHIKSIVCYDQAGMVKGYLPLVKSKRFGVNVYIPPPHTPYFGPVTFEEDVHKVGQVIEALLQPVISEAHLDFMLPVSDGNILPYLKLGFTVEARQNHTSDLDYDIDKVHTSKKRYLQKLLDLEEKGELQIISDRTAVDDILQLYKITSQRVKFSSRIELLKNILAHQNNEDVRTLLIKDKNGRSLAGAICPKDSMRWYHLINASERSSDSLLDKANFLSLYIMLTKAAGEGCIFDFEGSGIPGVANFYRMMGGKPSLKYRIQKTKSKRYTALHFLRKSID